MGRVLYVFPHPDDESFGPAPVLARQRREGHEVYLLTLTRGEATSQRHRLGYSLEKMGEVRHAEMQDVARALDLTGMKVLNYPDGGLEELDPRLLEQRIAEEVQRIQPHVLVTYAIHGISGHRDHLAVHPIVKRVYWASQSQVPSLQRLALFTLRETGRPERPPHLKGSPDTAIDCVVPFEEQDRTRAAQALEAYVTYAEVVRAHNPLAEVAEGVCFEFYDEQVHPPAASLFSGLDLAR